MDGMFNDGVSNLFDNFSKVIFYQLKGGYNK